MQKEYSLCCRRKFHLLLLRSPTKHSHLLGDIMIALSRFFLFSSAYLVLLILSSIASAETEYFSMITFLITSLAVGGWLYYLHKIAIEQSPGLKEILYVVLFLTVFTTIWAGFNIYIQSDYFVLD